MFTAGRPGKAGHSQIIVAIKVIVVWFFLARAILVVGVANGIPETTLWTLDIAFFALTALYVLVRESVNDGLSPKLLAFASLLTIGGAGIFTSLPRNLHLKDVVQQPLPGIGSVQSFIDGSDDKTFIDMTPVEHLARASKHLIITTERLVETSEIRRTPELTQIPYWLVDAVCHVPYGSYPGNMPYEYYFDEAHFSEWLEAEKDEAALEAFLQKYIYGTKDFAEYLALKGGETRMAELRALEPLHRDREETWLKITA